MTEQHWEKISEEVIDGVLVEFWGDPDIVINLLPPGTYDD